MRQALEHLFRLAAERELDVDLHVDESSDPGAKNLDAVARAMLASGFKRRVVCGHCSSLALRPAEEARAAIALCREAGLAIVCLPHVNLFLQDRAPGRTPRWRGITVLHELRAAGIALALGTDNVRDYFYAYGTPADLMGLPHTGRLAAGLPAELVIFPARRYSELLSRPHCARTVIRAGRESAATVPDYAELD